MRILNAIFGTFTTRFCKDCEYCRIAKPDTLLCDRPITNNSSGRTRGLSTWAAGSYYETTTDEQRKDLVPLYFDQPRCGSAAQFFKRRRGPIREMHYPEIDIQSGRPISGSDPEDPLGYDGRGNYR